MNSFNSVTEFTGISGGGMTGMLILVLVVGFVSCVVGYMMVAGTIGCGISLSHGLQGEQKDVNMITMSSIGLGLGILGLFIPLIGVGAIVFCFITIQKDTHHRSVKRYIWIPLICAVVTIVLLGLVYFSGFMLVEDIFETGMNSIGTGTSQFDSLNHLGN